jgi:hypothetical protein
LQYPGRGVVDQDGIARVSRVEVSVTPNREVVGQSSGVTWVRWTVLGFRAQDPPGLFLSQS